MLFHCTAATLHHRLLVCDLRERSPGGEGGTDTHLINFSPSKWVGFIFPNGLPYRMPNFSSLFCCALQNKYLVSHFHSEQWLQNKHFPLIWEEACWIINKHTKSSYLRSPAGMSGKIQREVLVLGRFRYLKMKDFNLIHLNNKTIFNHISNNMW